MLKFLALCALPILLLFLLVQVGDRLWLMGTGTLVEGSVRQVVAQDRACSIRKGAFLWPQDYPTTTSLPYTVSCTVFRAEVEYLSGDSQRRSLLLDSGRTRNHGQSVSMANHREGEKVSLWLDSKNKAEARDARFGAFWSAPFFTLLLSVGLASLVFFTPDE